MIQMDNEHSYISVVEEFSNLVYRIAYQNLMNVADAEDVVQEVFIKLLKHSEGFENREHIKAWLLRVTINQCRDYHKRLFRRKETVFETELLEQFEPARQEPEENFVISELRKLSEADRNIVYLHYYEGYSLKEIADMLNKSPNAVNVRLVRARKKLKTILSEEGFE